MFSGKISVSNILTIQSCRGQACSFLSGAGRTVILLSNFVISCNLAILQYWLRVNTSQKLQESVYDPGISCLHSTVKIVDHDEKEIYLLVLLLFLLPCLDPVLPMTVCSLNSSSRLR